MSRRKGNALRDDGCLSHALTHREESQSEPFRFIDSHHVEREFPESSSAVASIAAQLVPFPVRPSLAIPCRTSPAAYSTAISVSVVGSSSCSELAPAPYVI